MNHQSQTMGRYNCSQLFGYKGRSQKIIEEDNLTALKFDHTGRYLALGDKAGRLIAFQTDSDTQHQQEYEYYFEFQAHSAEFDTLKNSTLREEVLFIDWLRPQGKYLKMLTANSHTVKLWKMYEKSDNRQLWGQQPSVTIHTQHQFQNKSFSPLNSVQLLHNEEYIFTADEGSLYLWNLEKNTKAFLQRQLKEEGYNKLDAHQKITCAGLSCQRESLQVLATNRGRVSVSDSRVSLRDPIVRDFKCVRDSKSFLSQILNQYSAVKFLENDCKIVTRDLTSVKIWDMRNSREPFLDISIDQTIKNYVCDLFEAEVLSDSFKISEVKGNILTGNYGNSFQLIDPSTGENVQYQLDYEQQTRSRRVGTGQKVNPFSCEQKVLAHDYNKVTGQVAVSTCNCFFIFSQNNDNQQSRL